MTANEPEDDELVDQARRALPGDHRAFEELVRRHQGRVLANCRYVSGSPDDAQDLAQEVFVKVYYALAKFEGRSQFKSWLHRVKTNHCLNFLRKNKGVHFLAEDIHDLEPGLELQTPASAERRAIVRSEAEHIRAVLDEMPEKLRIALVLRDLDGFAYEEISEMLDIKLSATKMRIKRAREEFRRRFVADLETQSTGSGSHV